MRNHSRGDGDLRISLKSISLQKTAISETKAPKKTPAYRPTVLEQLSAAAQEALNQATVKSRPR